MLISDSNRNPYVQYGPKKFRNDHINGNSGFCKENVNEA